MCVFQRNTNHISEVGRWASNVGGTVGFS